MSALTKVLALVAIIVIIISAIGLYLLQYNNLVVDVDKAGSGVESIGTNGIRIRVVLRFINTGGVDLQVPPTDFEAWADGVYAGPGRSDGAEVPAHGQALVTATVDVLGTSAPLAYLALVDEGKDTIRLKGEAHVDAWLFTFDFPFDETFRVDA